MPAPAVLVALALAPAGSPPPPAALEGCSATPVEFGWQYDCADVHARIEDLPGTRDVGYPAALAQAARAVLGEGTTTRLERRNLGGAEVEVLVAEVPGKRGAMYLVATLHGPGRRTSTCFGGDERCRAVLSALAETAWRGANAAGSVRKERAPLAVAGRPLTPPPGCEATTDPGGGTISCGSWDSVTWAATTDENVARRIRTTFADTIRRQLAKPGWTTTESEIPCTFGGVETTCARVLASLGDDAMTVLWAAARSGNQFVFAGCVTRAREPGTACALLLQTR